ncbi:MAG: DUF1501 domain-containing protein, partial [Planctomycetes bacterium]|nr:DUF1501 domain-containing protein [Planctomycetota bacterium]
GGGANWSNGFLPAHFQGTTLRPSGSPILDLKPPACVTREQQRADLDLLASLNAADLGRHPHHSDLAARMQAPFSVGPSQSRAQRRSTSQAPRCS